MSHEDYRAYEVEFGAADALDAEWRPDVDETDDEFAELMAEAEELLAMTQLVRGPKLLQQADDGFWETDETSQLDVSQLDGADGEETSPGGELSDEDEMSELGRPDQARVSELRPFHDTWSLDDEWPIDEVGPIAEERPVTRWSVNRPLPGKGRSDARPGASPAGPLPSGTEHRQAEPERTPGSDAPTGG